MKNIKNLVTTANFIVVIAFLSTSCGKISESDNKYPRDFPQECIIAFDNHALFIEKVRASGRFDEESISERERKSLSLLENFKNPPRGRTPNREEYVTACNIMDNLTQSRIKGMENINNLSNDELERIVGIFVKNSSKR